MLLLTQRSHVPKTTETPYACSVPFRVKPQDARERRALASSMPDHARELKAPPRRFGRCLKCHQSGVFRRLSHDILSWPAFVGASQCDLSSFFILDVHTLVRSFATRGNLPARNACSRSAQIAAWTPSYHPRCLFLSLSHSLPSALSQILSLYVSLCRSLCPFCFAAP